MIALDHIAVWSDNLYRTTIDLSTDTGLGNFDGGYFPTLGLGQKVLSLGNDVYIEVESIVDHRMIARREPMALELERQTVNGDCFAGLCFRTDDLDELKRFAAHRGIEVSGAIAGGKIPTVASQRKPGVQHAPDFWNSWRYGKPNLYYVPNLDNHPSRVPIQPGTGDVEATGVTSIEVGGTAEAMTDWFGGLELGDTGIEIVFNGKSDGLYSVTFDTTLGTQTITLNAPIAPELVSS